MNGSIDIGHADKLVKLDFDTPNGIFEGYSLILPVKDPVWKAHAFIGLMCEVLNYDIKPKKSIWQRIDGWIFRGEKW